MNYFSPSEDGHELTKRLTRVYQQLESIDADKAPSRAGCILFGLGFSPQCKRGLLSECRISFLKLD